MAIRGIRTFGDPVLRARCEPVTAFDAELRTLIADLTDTLTLVDGRAGVAAPQIGVPVRVFVYSAGDRVNHVVNPVIERSGPIETRLEACLSLPGLAYQTPRAAFATVRGFDRLGEPIEFAEQGFLARVLQHETGHLDGALYVDELTGAERREAVRALRAGFKI